MNEQQQEIARTNVYKSCIICGNPGIERHSEVLPDKGVLIKVIHDDGKICEFVEYASISSFIERGNKKKDPKMMTCPKWSFFSHFIVIVLRSNYNGLKALRMENQKAYRICKFRYLKLHMRLEQ